MEREHLIQARARKHWTLEEAAEEIGVDSNTIYRWEHGLTTPRGYNLRRICEVYEASTSDLGLDLDEEKGAESGATSLEMPEKARAFLSDDLTMHLFALALGPHRNFLVLQEQLAVILEEHTMHAGNDAQISRRDALRRLVTLPFLTLKWNPSQMLLRSPVEDVLTQCAASIAACWELSKSSEGGDLALAFQGASAYLPTLKAIVKDSPRYRQEAASLVGQCSILRTILGWHLEGLREAAIYTQDAVTYAKEAQDIPLLLSALKYTAWVHYYSNRIQHALKTSEQALPLLHDSKAPLPSRLLESIYTTVAVMQAKNGQRATVPLRQAADVFFSGQEEGHNLVYVDYPKGEVFLRSGMALYQQGDYDQALDSLSQVFHSETLALKIALPERSRVEGLNLMTLAMLKRHQRDMERTLYCWQAAIQGAKALQSEQRFNEALTGLEIMGSIWSGEKRVAEVRDLAVHW